MSVNRLKFTKLSKHAPNMVVILRLRWPKLLWRYLTLWLMNVGHLYLFLSLTNLVLWCMPIRLRNKSSSKLVRSSRGQGPKMKIPPSICLRFKINEYSKREFPTKVHLTPKGSTKEKCLPWSLKREIVVVLMLRSVFVLSVVQKMKTHS